MGLEVHVSGDILRVGKTGVVFRVEEDRADMGARVLFRDSQGRDGQVDLTPTAPLYVGRALDCAIRTDDAMVSRKHSMIRMENGRFFVEDLGSSNGTHVNDVRVTKHILNHNDVVRCGSLWLRYVEDGPIAASG